jgi:hypothetical protein
MGSEAFPARANCGGSGPAEVTSNLGYQQCVKPTTFSSSFSKPLGYRLLLALELGIPYNALDLLGSTCTVMRSWTYWQSHPPYLSTGLSDTSVFSGYFLRVHELA